MATRRFLYGQAPPDRYVARTDEGNQIDPGSAIFPVVTQRHDGVFVPIGTGFFVAENGIFVTAAHVVSSVLDERGEATGR